MYDLWRSGQITCQCIVFAYFEVYSSFLTMSRRAWDCFFFCSRKLKRETIICLPLVVRRAVAAHPLPSSRVRGAKSSGKQKQTRPASSCPSYSDREQSDGQSVNPSKPVGLDFCLEFDAGDHLNHFQLLGSTFVTKTLVDLRTRQRHSFDRPGPTIKSRALGCLTFSLICVICDLRKPSANHQRATTIDKREEIIAATRHSAFFVFICQPLNNENGLLKHSFITRSRHLFTHLSLSRSFRTTNPITLVVFSIPIKTVHSPPPTRARIRYYSYKPRSRCCRKFWGMTIMPNWQRESARGSEALRMPNVKLVSGQ